ncbi:TonB-dependent receptor [Lutibacter sp. A80]|uniref:TonB-dependent receptor n=1 Tax=Lutibacter sp. A80 TaxID=2918453 RepID=UPI001F05869F|nr:TonB-dependent receptor [Lutibacter sp. A80]UMB59803.1 TonB-dependent receptor [Lutibacter sp. A80]
MKNFYIVLLILISTVAVGQTKGTISGIVLDKEVNNSPLPFANVFIKGTSVGTTTEFEGEYTLQVDEGSYTVVFSFIGYQTVEIPNVIVSAGENTKLDQILSASQGVSLSEIQITGSTKKESERALLTEQKKATIIKESIGSERLAKTGVSNAAVATSKISGVTKNEGSGDIFIRGLGDRYLTTTMNGLPIPSDDVEKKNIELNLFSTDIIQNVGISKTYSSENYIDQASGNVDITTKEYNGGGFSIGISGGSNSTVLKNGIFNNFRATQNTNDLSFGFYTKKYALINAITLQSWNTETRSTPLNFGVSIAGGKKLQLFEKDLTVFATLSHKGSYNYESGIFKKYRSNVLNNSFTDVEAYKTTINTTGLFNLSYRLNNNHKIKFTSLFVNKTIDNLFEQGRNGEGYVFDQDPSEYGAFVRDQNLKQTRMFVNQVLGTHDITENNKLNWGVGYNYVIAKEPNRIRNEVSILDENTVQFAHVGDFQQRKSDQKIKDVELNGTLKDQITFNTDSEHTFKLNFGADFRQKERNFNSLFVGVRAKGFQVTSIDDLSVAFDDMYFNNGTITLRERPEDIYNATLETYAGFANLDFSFNKLTGNIGVRYENDNLGVNWDVTNYVGRIGSLNNDYNNLAPSLNFKYELNETNFLRLAGSKTITLPEFKELAPFEYVSPTGRVTKGNPELKESTNYNVDLKWELYPSSKELISVTSFYKRIEDPINLSQTRGSSGNFSYDNTGEKADVLGLEFETRFNIIDKENSDLNININATKMWFNQDLLEEFQYNNKTASDLQGASDFIVNTALSYSNNQENEFNATLSGNYSSDKIYALGAPEDFSNSAILYNDEIIEEGFVTLDLVLSKQLSKQFSVKLVGKNLLNPSIEQSQKVKPLSSEIETNEIISSYKKGLDLSIGFKYTF